MTKLSYLNKIDKIKSFKAKNFQKLDIYERSKIIKPYIYERSKMIYKFKIYKLN